MIVFGKQTYIPALKEMWRLCFPTDPEIFIQFYFSRIYQDNNTLIYLEDDKPVAALQILPYSIQSGKQIYQAGYISGAMTHPDHRQQGLMPDLLNYSFDIMKERNYTFSFLIPQEEWLQSYYTRFGYKKSFLKKEPLTITQTGKSDITENQTIQQYTSLSDFDLNAIYNTYLVFLKTKKDVVLKSREQLSLILEDLFLDGGSLFVCQGGIAFIVLRNNSVVIKELFSENKDVQSRLIDTIAEHYPQKEITLLNGGKNFSHYSGMIKSFGNTDLPEDTYMSLMLD